MAEPFDTIGASFADVIDRLAKGEITEAQAATALAPLLAATNDGEFGARIEEIIGVMGRVTGTLIVEGPPSNLLGAPGSNAWDRVNKVFYGPKDAVTGWPPGDSMTEGPAGPALELRTNTTHVQWRVIGTTTWNNLIALSSLKGADGGEVSLQKTATHVQWRLGAGAWVDLIPLADLKGEPGLQGDAGDDGRNVELQKTATHVQWRLVGEATWVDLIPLADLSGSDGTDGQEVGIQTTVTHIQWRLGNGAWTNLIALSLLKGVDGEDGADGREVQLQTTPTHIQWRYAGVAIWTDLIARSLLKGDKGDRGDAFTVNAQGSLAGRDTYDGEAAGFSYLDVDNGDLYFKTASGWSPAIPFGKGDPGAPGSDGDDGADGREVQLQKSATHIQWRYAGESGWTSLVALIDLKGVDGTNGIDGEDGANGLEVSLQKSVSHIQWRLGAGSWVDLIALADLKGEDGSDATVTFATAAEVRAGAATSKAIDPAVLAAADGYVAVTANGAFTLDFSTGRKFKVTLTANSTMTITGLTKEISGVIRFQQDATGGRTLGLNAAIKKVGAYTLSTAANAVDRCGVEICNGVAELTALEKGLG